MSKKPEFTVYHTREYTDGNGEVRNFYTDVGAAWGVKDGGMSVQIMDGLALSGRFVILRRKDKAADDGAAHEGGENEIPF
jgi:hypothetical protein